MSESETPESLLPYDEWTEEALREVVTRALVFAEGSGLPGSHHYYITFRTDHPGTSVPQRLRAQYPGEMTIVLQHQFWDLKVDRAGRVFSVGLSFGGVPSTLVVPLDAVTGFADPYVRFGLQFRPILPDAPEQEPAAVAPVEEAAPAAEAPPPEPQVVSLDAFRRRTQKD